MPNSHSLHSSNGQKYAQLDFAQVTEKGLKPLIDALTKQGVTVENVEASNRATKKDGVGVKQAVLRFQDQQQVTVQVNDSGDLVGFKLNGKSIGVQHADTITKVASSLAGAVRQNSQKFTDGLAKKAAKVVDTSNTRPAVKSNVQRLKEAKTRRDALSSSVNEISSINTRLQSQVSSLTQSIEAQTTRLSTAQGVTVQLKEQLKALEASNAA